MCFQLRRSPLFIENGANCDCASLEQTQHVDGPSPGTSDHESFLAMGRRLGDHLAVDLILPYSRRSRELRRAIRAIRLAQGGVCDGGSTVVDSRRSRPRRPGEHRGGTSTMGTTTTTTQTIEATTTTAGRDVAGRTRNRQSGSRRNRGRNREARQRARQARRERMRGRN